MGIEFKLSDRELPVSPAFINFLAQWLLGRPFEHEIWADQLSEALSPADEELHRRAFDAAARVMSNARGRELVARAYSLLFALLTGDLAPLQELQSRFHFVSVVGVPRTGGSYVTAELYRAIGMVPEQVPNALAHDSFPESGPFQLQNGINSWVLSLKTMAEYLTMVELFFADQKSHAGRIVVPKKLTKSVYAGGFFHRLLGEGGELDTDGEASGRGLCIDLRKVRRPARHWPLRRALQHRGMVPTRSSVHRLQRRATPEHGLLRRLPSVLGAVSSVRGDDGIVSEP